MALALGDGAEARDRRAGRVDADLARVEHAEAEDVAVLHRAGADDLGEEGDADAEELAGLAAPEGGEAVGLLGAQRLVVDGGQRLLHGGVVVAAVVLPAERRVVGELLLADEVLHPELGRVHAELGRQHVDHALDEVGRLGHPERAAVGDPARRLVGVDAVDGEIRHRDVVAAGADVEEAGRELGRVGAGVEGAVVGGGVAPEAGDPAVLRRGDAPVHGVVAGEAGGHQVLHPVLDPLHRLAGDDRGDDGADVARVDRDLVAEAAADVGGDDADVVLGDAGDERGDGADRVRGLEGAPDGQLAVDLVHRRRRSRRSRSGRDGCAGRRSSPRRPRRPRRAPPRWPPCRPAPR